MTHYLTEEDFELNPELRDADLSVGDTVELVDYSEISPMELEADGNIIEVKECMTIKIDGVEKYIVHEMDL